MMHASVSTDQPRVAATELSRNFGLWQDRAATQPIFVTHHGRTRVVLLSLNDYARLGDVPPPQSHDADSPAARLDTVLAQMEEGFIAIDERFRVTAANAVAAMHLRRAREALIGCGLAELFPEVPQSMLAGHVRRALTGGQGASADVRSVRYPDVTLSFRVFPLAGGAGLLFRSIDAQKRAELLEARLASLEQALCGHDAIGVGRIGLRGCFERVEAGLARMAGFEPARLLQARLADILALPCRAAAAEAVEAVLNGAGRQSFPSRLLVNGGDTIDVTIALSEIRESIAVEGATVVINRMPGG
jgi:PAS domain-containing protein